MPAPRTFSLALLVAAGLSLAAPARATDGPLLLFGGPNLERFLGCLNCGRSEPFSVWNENSEYGSTTHPDSIWNRNGVYGSPSSPFSPWNETSTTAPVVVDRVGNKYGYLSLNEFHPDRVARNAAHPKAHDLEFLVRLLEEYDWIIDHLDEARARY